MFTTPQATPSRRVLMAWLSTTAILGPATIASAQNEDEHDPSDRLPRYFSRQRFMQLDRFQIYDVNLAVRRGHRITIEGFSSSESRRIIREAAQDWPATRRSLRDMSN